MMGSGPTRHVPAHPTTSEKKEQLAGDGPMRRAEKSLREEIVARSREMNAAGINQGTSGNISARFEDRMLITPSAMPYEELDPEMLASIALDDPYGNWKGPVQPSTEWRFHHALLRGRQDAEAVVHAHPTFCTALAITQKEIPACHYMIAAFGGNNVRCSGYATFGTDELSRLVVEAMTDRTACLLANHGMITIGESLARAMWRAIELETIARQYCLSLLIGGPVLLDAAAVDEALERFSHYGEPANPEEERKPRGKRHGEAGARARC